MQALPLMHPPGSDGDTVANKRMFSSSILESDSFLDLPPKSRDLYIYLNMCADDDGFASPKSVMRLTGSTASNLQRLIDANFVIPFDSGVVCIADWNKHNTIRRDRYHETIYQKEFAQLEISSTGRYILSDSGNQMATSRQPSIDKKRLDKISLGKKSNAADAAVVSVPAQKKPDVFAEFAGDNTELLSALREFDKMRTSKKKPLTDRARKMLCDKLTKDFQPCEWVQVLEQSIFNTWQGIFPLTDSKTQNQPKKLTAEEEYTALFKEAFGGGTQ